MENWKDIDGYEGYYMVSDLGRVKSLDRRVVCNSGTKPVKGQILKYAYDKDGYKKVTLQKERKAHRFLVHRLVAIAFIPNPDNKPQVNHKNGIKTDVSLANLEWATESENTKHAFDYGLCAQKKGIENRRSKPVTMCSLDGKPIRTFGSIREAARQTKAKQSAITACVGKKALTAAGYLWVLKSEDRTEETLIDSVMTLFSK